MIRQDDSEIRVDWSKKFQFPYKRAVLRWLLLTLQLFVITIVIVGVLHAKSLKNLSFWKDEVEKSEESLLLLQEKMKKMFIDNEANKKLKREWKEIEISREKHEGLIAFLGDVSRLIPRKTWLERLVIAEDGPKNVVSIVGFAKDSKDVLSFFTQLSKLKIIRDPSMKYHLHEGGMHKFRISAEFMLF